MVTGVETWAHGTGSRVETGVCVVNPRVGTAAFVMGLTI